MIHRSENWKVWQKRFFIVGLTIGSLLFFREILRAKDVLAQSIYSPNKFLFLPAILLNTLAYLCQVLCWNMIMQYIGIQITFWQSIQSYSFTFLSRYIPGSVWGYLARHEWLRECYRISYIKSSLASVLEIILLVLSALFFSTGGIGFFLEGPRRVMAGVASWMLLVLIWLGMPSLTARIRHNLPAKRKRYWHKAVILSLMTLSLHGGTVYLTSFAIYPHSSLDLIGAIYTMNLSWLLGFAFIFVPAGIGIRETALSLLLANHFNFPARQASMIAVTVRSLLILAELEWIIIGLILRKRYKTIPKLAGETEKSGFS